MFNMPMPSLYLANWSDVLGEPVRDDYIDYQALLGSDDEFLVLESLLPEDFDDEY